MCDFRNPPTKIIINNIEKDVVYRGVVTKIEDMSNRFPAEEGWYIKPPYIDDVKEEGIYYICATGAYYAYFDGNSWLNHSEAKMIFDNNTPHCCGPLGDYKRI